MRLDKKGRASAQCGKNAAPRPGCPCVRTVQRCFTLARADAYAGGGERVTVMVPLKSAGKLVRVLFSIRAMRQRLRRALAKVRHDRVAGGMSRAAPHTLDVA
jgi:hypothetical protein